MLFESLGQGYIFLLILCVGCVFAGAEIVGSGLFKKFVKNIKKYEFRQKNTNLDKFGQKYTEIDKNGINWNKMEENRKNWKKMDKNGKKWNNLDKNRQKWKKIEINRKKWKKMDKNIPENSRKILKNAIQFAIGFGRACVYFGVIFAIVWLVDFGCMRAYHILAFLLGFCVIKTIFASRNFSSSDVI